MKKILIILLVFCPIISVAQVHKYGATTINKGAKGDKGDMPSFTINGELVEDGDEFIISGEANPNYTYVTNLTELQSVTSNEQVVITGQIDLGGATVNIPSGVRMYFEGGSFENGTLNGDETYIKSIGLNQIFASNLTVTGTFSYETCYVEWFGFTTSETTENNMYAAERISDFIKTNGGVLEFSDFGVYNIQNTHPRGYWEPKEGIFELGDDTHVIIRPQSTIKLSGSDEDNYRMQTIASISGNVITLNSGFLDIQSPLNGRDWYVNDTFLGTQQSRADYTFTLESLAFTPQVGDMVYYRDTANYIIFKADGASNLSFTGGGHIIGNRDEIGNQDQTTAIKIKGTSNHILIDNLNISQIPADAVNFSINSGYIGQDTNVVELGDIDIDTGAEVASTEKVRSITKFNINDSSISDAGYVMGVGSTWWQLQGTPDGRFSIFFYDVNDNYLGGYENVYMYHKLPIYENSEYVRVVFDTNVVETFTSTTSIRFEAAAVPSYVTITNNHFFDLGRQGISITGVQDCTIQNNHIHNVYGTPAAAVDLEDARWANMRINILGNYIHDCEIGIISYNSQDVTIKNNIIRKGTRTDFDIVTGVSISEFGGRFYVENNILEHTRNTSNLNTIFKNNKFKYSNIEMNNGEVSDNFFLSSSLNITSYTDVRAIVKGNRFQNDYYLKKAVGINHSIICYSDAFVLIEDNVIEGDEYRNSVNISTYNPIVKNITLIDASDTRFSNKEINGLTSKNTNIYVWSTANTNDVIKLSNFEIKEGRLRINGSTDSSDDFYFKNIDIQNDTYTSMPISFNNSVGDVKFDNLSVRHLGTSPKIIDFEDEVTNLIIRNSTFETINSVDLIDSFGTSVNAFIFMNNFLENVNLNSRVGDIRLNNIVDGVLVTD